MTVNFEIKGMLAKCLAMEDIIIEHKKVETACFNVHTRCLTLPLWEKASDNIYSMLVLHEISHSLWSPDIDWTKTHKIPGQFVNICEDVRVEKLCKRRYPGSPKSFYAGYKELSDQDFFAIGDDDISTYNLADRANLYFKIGCHLNIEFTSREKEIIEQISKTESFEDVLNAAEVLYKYCKEEELLNTELNLDDNNKTQTTGSGTSEIEYSEQQSDESSNELDSVNSENSNSDESSNEIDSGNSENSENSNSDDYEQSENIQDKSTEQFSIDKKNQEEPEVKTVSSLEDSIKNLVNSNSLENVYIELPDLNLDAVIVSNSEIHKKCHEHWNPIFKNGGYNFDDVFTRIDKEYKKFKNSSKKEVDYLVKEFECKKAADSYARASTSSTGILDCSLLHTYKFNDDIFKKMTTIPEGKNHGLIFILDWSGSMGDVMFDTVKQLYNLVWFCKKVSIPFEVYAFTDSYPNAVYNNNSLYKKREGLAYVHDYFSLMNIFTSKVNSRDLEIQMKNLFRIAYSYRHNSSAIIPPGMGLSGTPLNESMVALHKILPKFKKENNLQKIHCVVLTDGEGSPLKYHKEFNRRWENEPYIGTAHSGPDCFLRDRKIGTTYSLDCPWWQYTDVLLHNLRDNFTDVNFIGIRILEGCNANNFIRRYNNGYLNEELFSSWKKYKSFSIKNSGYHAYFGLSSSHLSQNDEFQVSESATKSEIKNAFLKSLRTKKMNKKILQEFISLIV